MEARYDLTLKAEIIGVMEGAGGRSMKVLVKPLYLTIPSDVSMHLGDPVLIDAQFSLRAIRPDVENEDFPLSTAPKKT